MNQIRCSKCGRLYEDGRTDCSSCGALYENRPVQDAAVVATQEWFTALEASAVRYGGRLQMITNYSMGSGRWLESHDSWEWLPSIQYPYWGTGYPAGMRAEDFPVMSNDDGLHSKLSMKPEPQPRGWQQRVADWVNANFR